MSFLMSRGTIVMGTITPATTVGHHDVVIFAQRNRKPGSSSTLPASTVYRLRSTPLSSVLIGPGTALG